MDDEPNNTVCIIGAGVSGLVTAKVLQHDGFDVTIFEKESTIGGVWAPSCTYAGLGVQNPQEHYAFTDFPYPETASEISAHWLSECFLGQLELPDAGTMKQRSLGSTSGRRRSIQDEGGVLHRRSCGLLRR